MKTIKPKVWKVYNDGSLEFEGYYIDYRQLTTFEQVADFVDHLSKKAWFVNNVVNNTLVDEDFIVACAKSFKLRDLNVNPFTLWYAPNWAKSLNDLVDNKMVAVNE